MRGCITYLGAATNEQYEAYLVELGRILTVSAARYARVGQVHDATAWTRSNAHQRQMHRGSFNDVIVSAERESPGSLPAAGAAFHYSADDAGTLVPYRYYHQKN